VLCRRGAHRGRQDRAWGEFAVHLALATGRKAFYTTPIKALSNQKYHDLCGCTAPRTSVC
jgi:superfamily II RNA helicase